MASRNRKAKRVRIAIVRRAVEIVSSLRELFVKALEAENERRKARGEETLQAVVASWRRIPSYVVAYAKELVGSKSTRSTPKNRRPVFYRPAPCR